MAISWTSSTCGHEIRSTGYGVVGERMYVDKIRVHERAHTSAEDRDTAADKRKKP